MHAQSRLPRLASVCLNITWLVACGLMQFQVHAAQVTFRWDYDPSGAAGFVLHCGPASGSYTAHVNVGNVDTCTVILKEGVTSFCAVTVYDPSGVQSGYSNEISVFVPFSTPPSNGSSAPGTTPPPPNNQPLGLVAAYGFEEGTGTVVVDSSGNNNTGRLSNGVARTAQGRFGKALAFNGSTGLITIPNSVSLQLVTGMTLEAWVKPSTVSGRWRDVIYKGDNRYALGATSANNGLPAAGGTFGVVYGKQQLAANTWSHLAVTYDGATLRLYVNGTLASSVAYAGNIGISSNPLQIGGDSLFGQYFDGSIDEVRVYNRSLTQQQIQTDMGTAVTN